MVTVILFWAPIIFGAAILEFAASIPRRMRERREFAVFKKTHSYYKRGL